MEQTSSLAVWWTYKGLASSVISRLSNPARDIHLVVMEWINKSADQQFPQGNHFTILVYVPGFFPLKQETEGKSGNPETDKFGNISQIHVERDVTAHHLQVLYCTTLQNLWGSGFQCRSWLGRLVSPSALSPKAVSLRRGLVTSLHASFKWTDLCSTCIGTAKTQDSDLF